MTAYLVIASALAGAVTALVGVIAFMRLTEPVSGQTTPQPVPDEVNDEKPPTHFEQIDPVDAGDATVDDLLLDIDTPPNGVDVINGSELDEFIDRELGDQT